MVIISSAELRNNMKKYLDLARTGRKRPREVRSFKDVRI